MKKLSLIIATFALSVAAFGASADGKWTMEHKAKDQTVAAAAIHRYLELKHPEKDAFGLMLRYAISEDGALHAEKFYRTTREEYARTRPAFRGRYLVALARVTASESGQPAPGYAEACKLLGV